MSIFSSTARFLADTFGIYCINNNSSIPYFCILYISKLTFIPLTSLEVKIKGSFVFSVIR